MENNLDINQIILIIIVVLLGLIIVFGIYFLTIFLHNKKNENKINSLFENEEMAEEKSLLNAMDEKRNIYRETKSSKNTYINENQINNRENDFRENDSNQTNNYAPPTFNGNPFGVDMTPRTKDNKPLNQPENTPADEETPHKFIN